MQPKSVTGAELWEYEHKYQYTTHQQHNGVRRRLEPKWSITIHVWQRVRITRYCGHCQLHSCNLAVAAAILSPIYTNIYLHTRAGPLKSLSFSLVYALWRAWTCKNRPSEFLRKWGCRFLWSGPYYFLSSFSCMAHVTLRDGRIDVEYVELSHDWKLTRPLKITPSTPP